MEAETGGTYVPLADTADLISDPAAMAPDKARKLLLDAIATNDVRLKDGSNRIVRYHDTPAYRSVKDYQEATRAWQRGSSGERPRFNPLAHRRGEPAWSGPPPPAKPRLACDQLWDGGYSVHLGDLEKVLAREFNIAVQLSVSTKGSDPINSANSIDGEVSPTKKPKSGRKPKADWGAMQDDLFVHMTHPEGGKLTRADAIRWALDWCSLHGSSVDAETTVEPYVDKCLAKFDEWVSRNYSTKKTGN